MRTLSLLAVVLLCGAAVAFAQAAPDWTAKETAMWQAVKDKNMSAFRSGLDSTFVGVYADGFHNRDTEVSQARQVDLKDFHLSDLTVRRLNPQTVLLTYKVVASGAMGGTDLSGAYWVSSIWERRGTQWRTVMHTEIKAS